MDPTVGRIVHFVAPAPEGGETYAAIVTKVHDAATVDVCTFGSRSMYFHERVIAGAEGCRDAHWRWPPKV